MRGDNQPSDYPDRSHRCYPRLNQAKTNLENLTVHRRPVNNHNQIKQITNQVGAILSAENLKSIARKDCPTNVKELIIQIDEGHLPIQEKNKRSFEVLCTVIYRPENIEQIDKHHRQITDKSCAMSAVADELATMKTYALNAAHKQGMTKRTIVTALADGANNCWSVAASLVPHCKKLEPILDWFHIVKKFENVKGALGETFDKALLRAKWRLWHGDAEEALSKLTLLKDNLTDENKLSRLNGLYKYIKGNKDYIVDYGERQRENKTFTSQVAESHIESMINARHKASGKIQWTRNGAHNVLQIRAIIKSEEWDNRWQGAVISALVPAA